MEGNDARIIIIIILSIIIIIIIIVIHLRIDVSDGVNNKVEHGSGNAHASS